MLYLRTLQPATSVSSACVGAVSRVGHAPQLLLNLKSRLLLLEGGPTGEWGPGLEIPLPSRVELCHVLRPPSDDAGERGRTSVCIQSDPFIPALERWLTSPPPLFRRP